MKKLLALVFIFIFAFVLVACGDDTSDVNDNGTTTPENDNETMQMPGGNDEMQGGHNERMPLEIIESGYGFATWAGDPALTYGIVLYNPNNEAVEFPSYRITVRREDNTIIGTNDQILIIVYPGQSLSLAGITMFEVDPDEFYSVEFESLDPDDWNWTSGEFVAFETVNTNLSNNTVTGEVLNHNDRDFDGLRVDMMIRDSNGQIVGGDNTFIRDGISANGTTPFQMDIRDSIIENIDGEWEVGVYASPW